MKQQQWLNISILLFVIFIIIPIILRMFNIQMVEGFKTITDEDGTNTRIQIVNDNLMDISKNIFSDDDAHTVLNDTSGNMVTQILTLVKGLSDKIEQKETPQFQPLKCVANFGTNIGDDLPNGAGVLTNTKYVCPSEYPTCSGLVCGEKYGTCGI
jgi:hypothetical protein